MICILYFEHLTKWPSGIKVYLVILIFSIIVGLVAFVFSRLINIIDKRLRKILYKPLFFVRRRLKKHGFGESDFDFVDSMNEAIESTARGRFFYTYLAWISVCVFILVFSVISYSSQKYSIDYSDAVADISILENDLFSFVKGYNGNVQCKDPLDNADYYLCETQIIIGDDEYLVQFCYDKIDKMKKICIKIDFCSNKSKKQNTPTTIKLLTKIFNRYALKRITVEDLNSFILNHDEYTTDIVMDNRLVFQYDYTDEFGTLYLVENQSNTELLLSGIIKE